MNHGFLLFFCEHLAQLRSVGCLISLYKLPPNEFLPPLHRLRTCALVPISILALSLLPPLHVTGHYGAKRPRKFFKIEASHAKRFIKFFSEGLFVFSDFLPRFQNHPPMFCWSRQYVKVVNVCGGGRVVGLARLRKSLRIVNHPPPRRN